MICSLFDTTITRIPKTQGIKYTGSKLKFLPNILWMVTKLDERSVLDGFSGSTRVSQAFAQCGYQVTANDTAIWSEVLGMCYLKNRKQTHEYKNLIEHLNHVSAEDGWFTEHYGGLPNAGSAIQADGLKRPWQIHNTRKLDGIRDEIDRLTETQS